MSPFLINACPIFRHTRMNILRHLSSVALVMEMLVGQSMVDLPIWSSLKYPNNFWMDSVIDIHGPQRMNSNDYGDFLTFPQAPL